MQRRGAREAAEGSQALDAASQLDDSQLGQGVLEDDDVAVPPEAAASTVAPRDCEGDLQCDQLLGIDQAIVQCVDRCGELGTPGSSPTALLGLLGLWTFTLHLVLCNRKCKEESCREIGMRSAGNEDIWW